MTISYGFYNSLNHDRVYNADTVGAIFDGIIEDGVYSTIGEHFKVSAAGGMNINVGSGRAWAWHTWLYNDQNYHMTIEPASGALSRWDFVCIKIDKSAGVRASSIVIVKGTPSSTPTDPVPADTNTVHYLRLAQITVTKGLTAIGADNIQQLVGTTITPFVQSPLKTISLDYLEDKWNADYQYMLNNMHSTPEGYLPLTNGQIDAMFPAN